MNGSAGPSRLPGNLCVYPTLHSPSHNTCWWPLSKTWRSSLPGGQPGLSRHKWLKGSWSIKRSHCTKSHKIWILAFRGTLWRATFIKPFCHIEVPWTSWLKHQNVQIYGCEGWGPGGNIVRAVKRHLFQVQLLAVCGSPVIFGVLCCRKIVESAFIFAWPASWVYADLLVSMPSSCGSHLWWSPFQIIFWGTREQDLKYVNFKNQLINFVWEACRGKRTN